MVAKKASQEKPKEKKTVAAPPAAIKKATEQEKKNKKADTIADKVFTSVAVDEEPVVKNEPIPETKFMMKPPTVKQTPKEEIFNPLGEIKFSAIVKQNQDNAAAAAQANRLAIANATPAVKFKTIP